VKADGTLACWGDNEDGQATPPAGTFTVVSAGAFHTCGLKTDGTLACWGDNEHGQATPPAGTFTVVSAGAYHTCGVKTDGTLLCWGENYYGQAPVVSVSPSSLHLEVVGKPCYHRLTAEGGTGGYSFRLVSGNLPAGWHLSSSGALSGAALGAGTYTITVRAEDGNGLGGSRQYTLTVNYNWYLPIMQKD
jgi:hypothetical protein